MPKYDFVCPRHGKIEIRLTYDEFDSFDYRCPAPCRKALSRNYSDSPPVATFYGSDFTRRSTDSRQNQNIDHHDKRSTQSYPGEPRSYGRDRSWV